MLARLLSPNNELLEINIYDLGDRLKEIVNTSLENTSLKEIYEENYLNKVNKFSKELLFCIKELGYKLYDPFNEYCKCALVYNEKFQIIPYAISTNLTERNLDVVYDSFDILTDEEVKLTKTIDEFEIISTGLVDDDGFISDENFNNKDEFAKLYLLSIMLDNKVIADDYSQNRMNYESTIKYLVERLGISFIIKNEKSHYEVLYNEHTSSKILDFVNYVQDYEIVNNTLSMMKINIAG